MCAMRALSAFIASLARTFSVYCFTCAHFQCLLLHLRALSSFIASLARTLSACLLLFFFITLAV